MFNIAKTVIETGKFELSDMLKKIETQWMQGAITDVQRAELIQRARDKANPENSVNIVEKIAELEKRILALEKANVPEVPDEGEEEAPEEVVETYPEYVVGKWYYAGDKITFKGLNYECIAPEGQVCTWNPNEYPAYWDVFEE